MRGTAGDVLLSPHTVVHRVDQRSAASVRGVVVADRHAERWRRARHAVELALGAAGRPARHLDRPGAPAPELDQSRRHAARDLFIPHRDAGAGQRELPRVRARHPVQSARRPVALRLNRLQRPAVGERHRRLRQRRRHHNHAHQRTPPTARQWRATALEQRHHQHCLPGGGCLVGRRYGTRGQAVLRI